MGALPADFAWTSEDDFKLKTAAQGGVPFESLATGAVQFSKQFTIQELHDRWHAILFDPVVAAEASARMLEFEFFALSQLPKSDNFDNPEDDISLPVKRTPESVRKRYYNMRKRMRIHPLNPLDLTFPNPTSNTENEEQPVVTAFVDADMDLDVNHHTHTLHHENQSFIGEPEDNYIDESDEFKEIYDLLEDEEPELPVINNQTLNLPQPDSFQFHVKEEHHQQSMATTTEMCGEDTNANNYLMEISNTLFALEDDLPLMDSEIDKSYLDGLSSLLLDSPNKDTKHDEGVHEAHEESKSLEGNLGINVMLPSTSGMNYKPQTSVIICTLNTEDPDIPSNDDVFLLPFTSPMPPHMTSIRDSGVGWKRDYRVVKPLHQKDNKYQKSQFDMPIIGSQLRSETLDHRINQDLCINDGQHESQTQVGMKSEEEWNHGYDIFTNCGKLDAIVGNNEETIQEEETLHEVVSKEVNDHILDVVELPIDDDTSSLSDDDIPSFSDIEAMILDEKLSEDEKNLYLSGNWSYQNPQALKYENPDIQKRFIRLEQAANGFMKRDMSSWDAFAILQGWQLIYYVKKPEILMGRGTEDVIVDIDLGREGDCRISRRQAIIQLDREGCFHIKNIGKYSISINSNELSTNQSTTLTSSCLIEIRGMAFLFETNEECIKHYVNSMMNKSDVDD